MAYQSVTDLSADTMISLGGSNKKTRQQNPTEIEGYYLGSRKIDDKKKKSGYSYIHTFQTAEGNVGVWGKTDLDRKLLAVAPGTMVLAQFEKMVPTPNGEMYKYIVKFDNKNTIEVSDAGGLGESGSFPTNNAEAEGGYFEEAEYGAEADNEPYVPPTNNKAKVESLLRGGKAAGPKKN